jgi:hypothetical protein
MSDLNAVLLHDPKAIRQFGGDRTEGTHHRAPHPKMFLPDIATAWSKMSLKDHHSGAQKMVPTTFYPASSYCSKGLASALLLLLLLLLLFKKLLVKVRIN